MEQIITILLTVAIAGVLKWLEGLGRKDKERQEKNDIRQRDAHLRRVRSSDPAAQPAAVPSPAPRRPVAAVLPEEGAHIGLDDMARNPVDEPVRPTVAKPCSETHRRWRRAFIESEIFNRKY